jgi:hypothetical protein
MTFTRLVINVAMLGAILLGILLGIFVYGLLSGG